MQRRQFLFTAALSPLAGTGGAARATETVLASPIASAAPEILIVDRHFAGSVALAASARRAGVTVHSIAGDLTSVWYEHLAVMWPRARANTLEGLTTPRALFCLELLAGDHRLHVVRRREVTAEQVHWRIERRATS
ncbi:MAG TPA: hypothetical protein VLJ58_07085 [Ramlibacter sp.]|nr:hypothetical protein [Ramlibacter sp.]